MERPGSADVLVGIRKRLGIESPGYKPEGKQAEGKLLVAPAARRAYVDK